MMYGWLRFCIALPSRKKERKNFDHAKQSTFGYFLVAKFTSVFIILSLPINPRSPGKSGLPLAIGAPVDPSHNDQWSGKPTVTRPVTYYMRPSFFSRPSSASSVLSVNSPRDHQSNLFVLRIKSRFSSNGCGPSRFFSPVSLDLSRGNAADRLMYPDLPPGSWIDCIATKLG